MIGKAAQNVQGAPRRGSLANPAIVFSRRHQRVNERKRPPGRRPMAPPPGGRQPPSGPLLPVVVGGFSAALIIGLVLIITGRPAVVPPGTPTPAQEAVAMMPTETATAIPATSTAVPLLPTVTPMPPTATELPPTPTPTPQPVTATATLTPTPVPDAVVTADTLNVRAGPGTSYEILARAHKGDPLDVTGKTSPGDWLEVVTSGKQRGWVSAELVALNLSLDAVPIAANIPPSPTPPATPGPTVIEVYFFFHYWCDACQEQARDFERLAKSYRSTWLQRGNRALAMVAFAFVPPIQEERKVDFYLVPLGGSASQNTSFQRRYAPSVPLGQDPGFRAQYDMSVHPVVIASNKSTGVNAVLSRGRTSYSSMRSNLDKSIRGNSVTPSRGWT